MRTSSATGSSRPARRCDSSGAAGSGGANAGEKAGSTKNDAYLAMLGKISSKLDEIATMLREKR
jgi:hypothetical protein